MSDVQLRQLLGDDAYLAQKNQSQRYTPQPEGTPDNPLDELDRELIERQGSPPSEGTLQKTSGENPLDDLDREYEEQSSSPERRVGKQFLQGALSSPAELIGGAKDIYSAGKEIATQKTQEYGTGTKLAQKYGVPKEPERATWYERLARAEGTGAPITALGTYLGGPVGGAATALGIGASALAEPYIESLASKLPWHTGPAAQIAAGALLGRKVGKVAGGVLTKKPITPTEQDFRDSAHAQYQKVDNSGITLEPNIAANATANKTLATLGPGADITSPKTVGLMKLLQPDPNGAPTDIRQVTATYKALGDVKPPIGKPKGDADYRAAQIARQDIKDYLDDIPNSAPYSVVSGHANIPDMYENWTNANGDWAAAERVGTVNRRFESGMAQAGTTYSGGNAFNAIRQKFRPLVDPLRFNRQFNKEETDYLKQHMVHGTLPQNTLRMLSKVAPNSAFGMWGNLYAGAQALGGSPQYLGLTAASALSGVAQKAAKAAQRANLREFRTLTASRAPLFKKLNPGFVKDEHDIGAGTAGGIGGVSEALKEAVPEYIHQGLDISKEAGGVQGEDEKKKKEDGGGYAMGHRLLKAVGGYDSSFFNQPTIGDQAMSEVALNRASGATPKDILRSVTSPTAQGIGQDVGMAMAPIEAYHGSRYDFNAFDSSKIGTGEGAQMFGYGHYLAENPKVANQYREDQAGEPTPWGMEYDGHNVYTDRELPDDVRNGAFELHKRISIYKEPWNPDILGRTKASLEQTIKNYESGQITSFTRPQEYQDYKDALKVINDPKFKVKPAVNPGHSYQVEIGSEPEHFLDWDKPLSEQSEHVKAALKPYGFKEGPQDLGEFEGQKIEGAPMTGAHAYKRLAIKHGGVTQKDTPAGTYPLPYTNEQAASKALQDAGIPGIRYLDQGSRGTGQGTHNYVVFDPKIIRIMRKYGIFGPAAVAGASMGQQKKPGGYDNPQGEQYADPEAFRLKLARLAAMPQPQTGVGGGVPFPQQAVGGGTVPQPNYRVGGYGRRGGYDDGDSMTPPGVMPQPGPIAQPGVTPQQVMGVLPQALKQGLLDPWVQNIAASVPGPDSDLSANAVPLMHAIGRTQLGSPGRGLPAGAANANPGFLGLLSGMGQKLSNAASKWRAGMPENLNYGLSGHQPAVRFNDGSVYTGLNHDTAMQKAVAEKGMDWVDENVDNAGFVNPHGEYVDEIGGKPIKRILPGRFRPSGGYSVSPMTGGTGF